MPDRDELEAAIGGLEAQRASLGDAVVGPALEALRRQLAELEAASGLGEADEERKTVTILFVDVSGFTALAETLDPEQVRELVNACFECLVPIVRKYGGTIDKFIGDEVMALFGAPVAHENDPERALRTALEMMDAMLAFNAGHKTQFGLHIGVNTGKVVAGTIGSRERRDYSVMGDAVNLAARLEDASSDGEIYVGPTTHRLTNALFDFEPLPPLRLKGKSAPVKVFRLLGLRSVPKPLRGIEGLKAELVGREREMGRMKTAIENLRRGSGSVVAVAGEAGVGKSRLIAEVLGSLAAGVSRAEGRALSHTTGMTYWMARDLLRGLVGIQPEMDPAQANALLHASIDRVSSENGADPYPYLARLLELPLPPETDEKLKFLAGEALHNRVLRAFRNYVAARAQFEPLILFWEDLHWCDPSSFLILETLLPLAKTEPLLLLLAYRPDDESILQWQEKIGFADGERYQTIELSPLTRDESKTLIQTLVRIEGFPDRIRELILDRAEGNPFFVEELLRSLLEDGVVRAGGDGGLSAANLENLQVPDTVQGVLMGRVDRLPPQRKQLLQHAAILGRVFSEDVLRHYLNHTAPAGARLAESLAELQLRGFIHVQAASSDSDREYSFKHAITHDVVYDSLLLSKRKELHQRAGAMLETLYASRRDEMAATLGYHFQKGEAHDKAFYYLRCAAERARASFANQEAIDFYRAAIGEIDALGDQSAEQRQTGEAAKLHEELGDMLEVVGRHDAAREAYQSAFGIVSAVDSIARSRLNRKIGFSYSVQRRFTETSDAYDKADAELGNENTDSNSDWWNEKIEVLLERLHLLYWLGLAEDMAALAQQRREVVEEKGRPIQRGMFYMILGLTELTRGRYVPSDKALHFAKLAAERAKGATELHSLVRVEFVLGFVHLWCGNLQEAVSQLRIALAIAEKIGTVVTQLRCLTFLTVAFRRMGNLEQVHRTGSTALTLAEEVEMPEYIAMAKANLAWAAWKEGDSNQTRELGAEALEQWHGMADPYGFDWLALLPLVATASAQNQISQAVTYIRGLFGPNQHPLPLALTDAARRVIEADEANDSNLEQRIGRLISVAKEIGYL